MNHWIVKLLDFPVYWCGIAEHEKEALLKMLEETTHQDLSDVRIVFVGNPRSVDEGFYHIAQVLDKDIQELIEAGKCEAISSEYSDEIGSLRYNQYDFYSDVIGAEFIVGTLEEYERLP